MDENNDNKVPVNDDNQDTPVQPLPNDGATPFSPPADTNETSDGTEPATDTGVDQHEQYDAGTDQASGQTAQTPPAPQPDVNDPVAEVPEPSDDSTDSPAETSAL